MKILFCSLEIKNMLRFRRTFVAGSWLAWPFCVLWLVGLARAQESVVAKDAKPLLVVSDCKFTEGPAVDDEGNVLFTDQPNDRILKVSTDGKVSEFLRPAGRSNGLFFAPDGKLIACADEKHEMWRSTTRESIESCFQNIAVRS